MLTMNDIFDLAYGMALEQWNVEMQHKEAHPGEMAEIWEANAWSKVEEVQKMWEEYKANH